MTHATSTGNSTPVADRYFRARKRGRNGYHHPSHPRCHRVHGPCRRRQPCADQVRPRAHPRRRVDAPRNAAQGDQVGLHAIGGDGIKWFRSRPASTVSRPNASCAPSPSLQPVRSLARRCAPRAARERSPQAQCRAEAGGDGSAREIVIVLTDGHEQDDEIRASLASLRSRGHELLLFHLRRPRRGEFSRFMGWCGLRTGKPARRFEADADAARAAWVDGYDQRLRDVAARLAGRRAVRHAAFPARRTTRQRSCALI